MKNSRSTSIATLDEEQLAAVQGGLAIPAIDWLHGDPSRFTRPDPTDERLRKLLELAKSHRRHLNPGALPVT